MNISPSVTDIQRDMLPAVLIANPHAGHSAIDDAQIVALLAAQGIRATVALTTPEDAGTGLARAAVAAGYGLVIAAGGDGTIEAVATGLLGSEVALGILPLGTQNNLAHSLHIPSEIAAACATLAAGKRQHIDVGLVNGIPFFEMVSIGVEAPLLTLGEAARHGGLRGMLQAFRQGLSILRQSRIRSVKLELDGKHNKVHTRQISICNTPRYGPGLVIAPTAQLDDGLLDVIITRQIHRRDLMRHYWRVLLGKDDTGAQIDYRRARTIRISGRHPLLVAVDGTASGTTPITIMLAPEQLTVMVPHAPTPSQPLHPAQRIWNAIASS